MIIERASTRSRQMDGQDLLLVEFNHRVANELAAAIAALRYAQSPARLHNQGVLINDAISRLEGFAAVHHVLARGCIGDNLTDRLQTLCRSVDRWHPKGSEIRIALSVDEVEADEETAWTVCAIAAELITNSLRHAFPKGIGAIKVIVRAGDGSTTLAVYDDGVSAQAPSVNCAGLGSRIVERLADRLGGRVSRLHGVNGTVAILTFPNGSAKLSTALIPTPPISLLD